MAPVYQQKQRGLAKTDHRQDTTVKPAYQPANVQAGTPSGRGFSASAVQHLQRTIGNQALQRYLAAQTGNVQVGETPEALKAAAQTGIRQPSGKLPFAEQIQRSFGAHDISHIQAHTGKDAADSAYMMNASAYATGSHVVFGEAPNLHTAAHEAAHVIQQQSGISLPGGIGQVGDSYEQHADDVASRVVQGKSAEDLLQPFTAQGKPGAVDGRPVQRSLVKINNIRVTGRGFDWGDHYTKIHATSGVAEGRGVKEEKSGTPWRTRIQYGPVLNGEGTQMEASKLGPDHPLGSAPTNDTASNIRKKHEIITGAKTYVAGHMLNDHLGGSGSDNRNLVEIPSKVNSDFSSKVEEPIKKIVNEQHGWVYFKVKATQGTYTHTSSRFGNEYYTRRQEAAWYQLDQSGNQVAGTRGDWSYDIPAPTAYAGLGATSSTHIPLAAAITKHNDTAWSKVSFDELILTRDDELRVAIDIQKPLIELLNLLGAHSDILYKDAPQTALHIVSELKRISMPTSDEITAFDVLDKDTNMLQELKGNDYLSTYECAANVFNALTTLKDKYGARLVAIQTLSLDYKIFTSEIEAKFLDVKAQIEASVNKGLVFLNRVELLQEMSTAKDEIYKGEMEVEENLGNLTPSRITEYDDDVEGYFGTNFPADDELIPRNEGSFLKKGISKKYPKANSKNKKFLQDAKEISARLVKKAANKYGDKVATQIVDMLERAEQAKIESASMAALNVDGGDGGYNTDRDAILSLINQVCKGPFSLKKYTELMAKIPEFYKNYPKRVKIWLDKLTS